MSKHTKTTVPSQPEESRLWGQEGLPPDQQRSPASQESMEETPGENAAGFPEVPLEGPLPDTDAEEPAQDMGPEGALEGIGFGETPEPVPLPPEDPVTQELPVQEAVKPKGDRGMVIFGGIVLLFAVFGLICSIVLATKGIHKLMEKPDHDGEYEWLLTPLVLQDPPQFASPEKAADSTLITAGVWRLIMNEDLSKYPVDSMNFITVPASDIEVQIKALFGDVGYTHQSVGDTELLIIYDEANRAYEFPAIPHVLAYTPDVEEILEEGQDTLHVTVGYIPPGPVWQKDTSGNSYQPAAEKQMTYTLKKAADGSWRVYAMGSVGGQEDPYPGDFGPVYPEPSSTPDSGTEENPLNTPEGEVSAPDVPATPSDEAGASGEDAGSGGTNEGESGDGEDGQ